MVDILPRTVASRLESACQAMPVVVLTGARQVGKCSLVRYAPFLHNHRLLDLDDQIQHLRRLA